MAEIHHMVLLKLDPAAEPGAVEAALEGVRGMRGKVDGVLDAFAGANVSPEGLARGYTHAILVRFADAAARDRYLMDPFHAEVAAQVMALTTGEAPLVVDIAVGG